MPEFPYRLLQILFRLTKAGTDEAIPSGAVMPRFTDEEERKKE
ncbi:MAG: hypothetical protein ACLUOI_12760 [Eisenbergiella sp.]